MFLMWFTFFGGSFVFLDVSPSILFIVFPLLLGALAFFLLAKVSSHFFVVNLFSSYFDYNWELPNLDLHGFYEVMISSSLVKQGNGCHVYTCIMYFNMSYFVGSLKFPFIS
jgi:hypothetical protein